MCSNLFILGSSPKEKHLFVPTIVSEEDRMDFVRLHDEEDFKGLPVGLWGIPQPTAQWKDENRQSGK